MGGNDTKNTSRPLTASEMQDRYQVALQNIQPNYEIYKGPQYESMSNGDYDRLEESIVKSRTAPIDYAWDARSKSINQSMADRGLWSSGQVDKKLDETYAQDFLPQYTQAGAEAATQRYNLQAQDIAGKNAFALDNAKTAYESKWRDEDYKAGLWNNTGGIISTGNSSGWSI